MARGKLTTAILVGAVLALVVSQGYAASITTTFNGGNEYQGNMFDLTNVSADHIVLTGAFEGNFDALVSTDVVEFWYRRGTYVGHTSSAAGWSLLGSATDLAWQGENTPTPFDIGATLAVESGRTIGMFMYLRGTYGTVNYTNGMSTYNDGVLQLDLGVGKGDVSTTPGGAPVGGQTFPSRTWNGTIEYEDASPPPIPEPITMIAVFGGITGLGGYLRKRRMA